jgi:cystathionine beta-synthase
MVILKILSINMSNYPKHSIVMESAGLDKVCKWAADTKEACPHIQESRAEDRARKVKNSIIECVGNTPMVRVQNLSAAEGIECDLMAKCEFMNPCGSTKDRVGRRLIMDAEKSGRLQKGDVLIEPTTGNTGIGLSMTAAARGYNMVITMPEKMSQEKQDVLSGLGATIVRTPTDYAFDHLYSHFGMAVSLKK